MDYQSSSVAQSCPTLCNPMNARPPCPSIRIPWNSTHKNTGVSCLFPCPGDLPNPGIKPGCPPLQADSLPSESPGKPKTVWFLPTLLLTLPSQTQTGGWVCLCVCLVTQSCLTLQPHGLHSSRLLCQWYFPGKNIRVCCHFQLQGIFLTPGSTQVSCTARQVLYCWATWEGPLPGVACPNGMCSRGHTLS